MTTKKFDIEGMTCNHCVKAVEIELSKLDLDKKNVEIGSAEVTYEENKTNENQIKQAIKEAGYKAV